MTARTGEYLAYIQAFQAPPPPAAVQTPPPQVRPSAVSQGARFGAIGCVGLTVFVLLILVVLVVLVVVLAGSGDSTSTSFIVP